MSTRYYARLASSNSDTTILLAQSPDKPNFLTSQTLDEYKAVSDSDDRLKRRIRLLRIVSRVLSTLLSLLVFISITIVFHTYLTTHTVTRTISTSTGPLTRGPWARSSKVWPTIMYFALSLASLTLNAAMLVAYACSIRAANTASMISYGFEHILLLVNFVLWAIGVSVYRAELARGGNPNDLWGWSCSGQADAIQDAFRGVVSFDNMCKIQTGSWVIGILHVVSVVLGATILTLVLRRRKSKDRVRRTLTNTLFGEER